MTVTNQILRRDQSATTNPALSPRTASPKPPRLLHATLTGPVTVARAPAPTVGHRPRSFKGKYIFKSLRHFVPAEEPVCKSYRAPAAAYKVAKEEGQTLQPQRRVAVLVALPDSDVVLLSRLALAVEEDEVWDLMNGVEQEEQQRPNHQPSVGLKT